MDFDDTILVEKLQGGDLHSFDLLFRKYGEKLFGFAFRYLKSENDAEELVQDVYIKIWESRAKLKKEASFRSYLFTIAYHEICKIFRRRNYHKLYLKEIMSGEGNTIGYEADQFTAPSLEQIEYWVDKLPSRRKEIFFRRYKEGKCSREIAAEMGISPGTVDNNISEALRYIRKNLGRSTLEILLFISLFLK